MSETITMGQIAKELKVSRNAVSAVVNGRSRKLGLSKATEDKIKDYIKKRGYVQSKSAMLLRNGASTDLTGILTCGPIAIYPHLVKALQYLSEYIKQKHGHVEIIGINTENIQHGLREVVSQGIKKLIWIHATPPEVEIINAHKLFPLLSRMKRVVIYNYCYSLDKWEEEYFKHGIQLVGVDRPACYRKAAEIFGGLGHSQIALDEVYAPSFQTITNTGRLKSSFEQYGFTVHGLRGTHIDVVEMTERLIKLHRKNKVSCAFIRNEQRAVEIMGRLQEAGINIPGDIAIMGFGNSPMTRWTSPPLTTFAFPVNEMCAKTVELINNNKLNPNKRSNFYNELVLRKSHQ